MIRGGCRSEARSRPTSIPPVADPQALHVQGQGTINNQPFSLDISGGALLAVNPEHPYPFKLSIKAAGNEIEAGGEVLKPFDLGQLRPAGGGAWAGPGGTVLPDATRLAELPAVPAAGQYQPRWKTFVVRDIKGLLGRSDISGTVDVDGSNNRPKVTATLNSGHLFLADLGALTGARAGSAGPLDQQIPPPGRKPSARALRGRSCSFRMRILRPIGSGPWTLMCTSRPPRSRPARCRSPKWTSTPDCRTESWRLTRCSSPCRRVT